MGRPMNDNWMARTFYDIGVRPWTTFISYFYFLQDAPPANVWKVSTWVWWEDHSPALSNLHHRQVFAKASKALPYGVRDFNLLTSLQSTIVPVSGLNLFCYKIVYCSEYPSAICLFDQNKLTNMCIQLSSFSSHWKKISDHLNWLPCNTQTLKRTVISKLWDFPHFWKIFRFFVFFVFFHF